MAEFEAPQTEEQDEREQDERDDVIAPKDGGPADPGYPVDQPDPVTARNEDPAAMSEHERNQRLSAAYEPPPQGA